MEAQKIITIISGNSSSQSSSFTSGFFSIIDKKSCMPTYFHEGSITNENFAIIEVEVQFLIDNHWTDFIKANAIIDTGATQSHIVKRFVSSEILDKYKNNTQSGNGAGGVFENILIPNVNFRFPNLTSLGGPFVYFLPILPAFDNSEVEQKRTEENKPIYDLFIGGDVLEKSEFTYKGIDRSYYLKFSY